MKSFLSKFKTSDQEPSDEIHTVGTIAVVVAMLGFIGSTFYILLNTYSS